MSFDVCPVHGLPMASVRYFAVSGSVSTPGCQRCFEEDERNAHARTLGLPAPLPVVLEAEAPGARRPRATPRRKAKRKAERNARRRQR